MKKNSWIVTGCLLAVVSAVSALLWQTDPAEEIPAAPLQTAVCAAVETPATAVARTETKLRIITPSKNAPEPKIGAINDAEAVLPENKEMSELVLPQKSEPEEALASAEPRNGDTRVIDGEAQIYILGFGWIKDEGGAQEITVGNPERQMGSGIYAADMYKNGNKIGIMGGGRTVHGKGDINKMVGIMGKGGAPPSTPQPEPPSVTGEIIDQTINEAPEKNSTPPAEKPDTTPPEN